MSNGMEKSLVIKKETIYDKIRNSIFVLIYRKDYEMIQRLEHLLRPKRPHSSSKIIIPKEIGSRKILK